MSRARTILAVFVSFLLLFALAVERPFSLSLRLLLRYPD